MSEYALTAAALIRWQKRDLPDTPQDQFDFWADLLEDFGPALLPFVLKPDYLRLVPYKRLGIAPIDVGDITPNQGECWLLFCFRGEIDWSRSPVRCDGFMLPCEWRCHPDPATGGHSPLLADSLTALADQVKQVLHGDDWYLYPSFSRFADKVAFFDSELFAPADCPGLVASAWSALASGLYLAQKGVVPHVWPFSSIQYDAESGKLMPVEGVVRKIAVAAGFRCRAFMVAPSQVAAARAELKMFASSVSESALKERLLSVTVASPDVSKNVVATVEDLATGTVTRKRRRTACGAVSAFLIAAILTFGGWYYAMWVCPTKEYYATAFQCQDGWVGRGRLSASAAARRVGNVLFTREGLRGHVTEVAWVDGRTRPAAEGDLRSLLGDLRFLEYNTLWQTRSVKLRLVYGKEERSECAYDAYGRETYRMKYQETRQPRSVIYTKNGWLGASDRQSAKQIAVWYDERGRVSEVHFLNDHNPPCPTYNFDGVGGYRVKYGNRVESVRFLDTDGTPIASKDAYCRRDFEFDELWRVRRISYFDALDRLALCSRGYAVCEIDYDGNGNPSHYRYFDAGRNPVSVPTRQGSAMEVAVRYAPDLTSRLYTCYGGQLSGLNKKTCVEEMRYDEYGFVLSRTVVLGVPNLDPDITVDHIRFDRQAPNLVIKRYLDLEEHARTNDLGVAAERLELNDDGMTVRSTLLDLNEKPIESEEGVPIVKNTYEGSNLTEVEGFDANGHSLAVKAVSRFDNRNLRISTEYFGTNGCPIVFKGYSKETFKYNKMRSVTEHACLLPYDMPATNTEGYSRTVMAYSPIGNQIIHFAYWYGTNHLVNCAEGYASLTNGYDESGNLVYVAFYDAAGKLVRTGSGYLIRKIKYDFEHHEIERINVDENEKLQNDVTGRAKYLTHYTAIGQNLGMTAFDASGKPRLPLLQFRKDCPKAGICSGDVLLACDQWRYSRESCDPMGVSLTKVSVLTGLVLARRQNGVFRLVCSPTPYNYQRADLAPCCFPPAAEDSILALAP